jgi:hypothetical protein
MQLWHSQLAGKRAMYGLLKRLQVLGWNLAWWLPLGKDMANLQARAASASRLPHAEEGNRAPTYFAAGLEEMDAYLRVAGR